MDPVDQLGVPASFYDHINLSGFPPEIRFLSFRQSKTGVPAVPVIVVYSAEEQALRSDCLDWLAEGRNGT